MSVNFEPTTPLEAYKSIIDQLVEEVTPGTSNFVKPACIPSHPLKRPRTSLYSR
jgi:hypothetical protein